MSGEGIVNTVLLPVYAERDILQIRTDELLYGMCVKITDTKERDRYRIETDYQYTGLVFCFQFIISLLGIGNDL